MNYTAAIAAVNEGKYASRSAWGTYPHNWYIWNSNGELYINKGLDTGPYTPSEEDEGAIDWFDGPDKPPHP